MEHIEVTALLTGARIETKLVLQRALSDIPECVSFVESSSSRGRPIRGTDVPLNVVLSVRDPENDEQCIAYVYMSNDRLVVE